ncbi:unnamed protein product [Sphagnum jensenii]|uniref:Uncharacterized protein n=1 Tax=Sphagnum jensenii TaxID=128206 RepID=A0ABP1BNK6_9BRYO
MVLFMILLVVVVVTEFTMTVQARDAQSVTILRSFVSSLHVQRQRSGTAIASTWRELRIQLPHQLLGDDTVLVHIQLEQPERRIHRLKRTRILEESFPRLLSMLVRKEKHGQWTVPPIQMQSHRLPGCNSYKSNFIMLQDLEGSHLRVFLWFHATDGSDEDNT